MTTHFRRAIHASACKRRPHDCPFDSRKSTQRQQQLQSSDNREISPFPSEAPEFGKLENPESLPGLRGIRGVVQVFRPKYMTSLHQLQLDHHRDFGDVIHLNLGFTKLVSINNPALVAELFRKEALFPRRLPLTSWQHWRRERNLPNSLITADGEEWWRNRQSSNKKLMRPQEVNQFLPWIDVTAKEAVNRWEKLAKNNRKVGCIDRIHVEVYKWAMESTANVLFGTRLGCLGDHPPQRTEDFVKAVEDMTRETIMLEMGLELHKRLNSRFYRRFMEAWDVINAVTSECVENFASRVDNAASSGPEPVASYMMSREGFSREQTMANIAELLLGGVDTTANTLLWGVYELSLDRRVQEQLRDEADFIFSSSSSASPDVVKKMSYVKAVVKETLRLHPAIPMNVRWLTEDVTLEMEGRPVLHLPRGTHVQVPNFAMGRDEKNFHCPAVFDPRRWIGARAKGDESFAWLPFGHGPRSCIGRRLAEIELYVLLLRVVQRFHLRPSDSTHEDFVAVSRSTISSGGPATASSSLSSSSSSPRLRPELPATSTTVLEPKFGQVFPVKFEAVRDGPD